MSKRSKFITVSTIVLAILSVPAFLLWVPTKINAIVEFTKAYPILAPVLLILWRILAIVIPPIPGGLLSIALIPVFGWWQSFLYSAIGVLVGTSIAFLLARKYQEPFVKKFVPLQQLHEWQDKISQRTQFFTFLGIRLTTGSVSDYISYIAGLSKIKFRYFFLATLISLWSDLVIFYIGGKAYQASAYLAISLTLIFVAAAYLNSKFKFFKLK